MLSEINRFVNWVRRRNPSARTWRDYGYDLKQFNASVGDCSPSQVSIQDIDRFISQQIASGHKATTINRRLASIISLYTFLADEDPLVGNHSSRGSRDDSSRCDVASRGPRKHRNAVSHGVGDIDLVVVKIDEESDRKIESRIGPFDHPDRSHISVGITREHSDRGAAAGGVGREDLSMDRVDCESQSPGQSRGRP